MVTITTEAFDKLYNAVNPLYETLSDIPDYWQDEAKALVASGKLKGDGDGTLNIRYETLRAVIIANR